MYSANAIRLESGDVRWDIGSGGTRERLTISVCTGRTRLRRDALAQAEALLVDEGVIRVRRKRDRWFLDLAALRQRFAVPYDWMLGKILVTPEFDLVEKQILGEIEPQGHVLAIVEPEDLAGAANRPPPARRRADRQLMRQAIRLAQRCRAEAGRRDATPKVGAVVARGGRVIGEAFRGELAPGDHAEFTLLETKLSRKRLAGATLFTTLEPCTSRNRPKIPCAERIVERRIKKVVIGMLDPNDMIRGRGEQRLRDAGIQVARFDTDLMAEVEELNRDFARQHRSKPMKRTKEQLADPVEPGRRGPNGCPIGYTKNGDKVEWVPDEENPGKTWPLLLRRNDKSILKAYNEFWDKVWWNRHQNWLHRIRTGEEPLTKEDVPLLKRAKAAARRIERKYGRNHLGWDAFEWGLLSGKLSALAWVTGAEWDESLDT